MPVFWFARGRVRAPRCRRPITWSVRRGGCRFAPGHPGACKPKTGRAA